MKGVDFLKNDNLWYKLDNAAKIYPAILSRKNPATFRVAVILYEIVDEKILHKAVNDIINRFPTMKVKLKKGIFWNFFETNNNEVLVSKEEFSPCYMINPNQNNEYLFRLSYFNKRISLEIFHALTDGTGGMEFLKSILFRYFELKGYDLNCENMIITNKDFPSIDEFEDSYYKIYTNEKSTRQKFKNAQHIKGKVLKNNSIKVVHGVLDVKELLKISKSLDVTLTEYLTSLYVLSVIKKNKVKNNKPITINIPINLRNLFESKSLRNFSYFVNISIYPNDNLSFDDILNEVKSKLKDGTKKENINKKLNTIIKADKNKLLRITPLFLKNFILKNSRRLLSDNIKTSTITNLGVIKLPDDLTNKVDLFEFILYCSPPVNINCGICTFNDKIVISFSRSIVETDVIQYFFTYLSNNLNLDVFIYSND